MPPRELYIRIDPTLARKSFQATARRKRARERRIRLDTLAKSFGFESWSKLETAVMNGRADMTCRPISDEERETRYTLFMENHP